MNNEPKEREDFEALDRMDEKQIVQELQGEILDKYVYRFQQGGRTVVGLSYAGVKAAIQRMGNITVSEPKVESSDELYTVYCSATDHNRNLTFWAGAQQAKMLNENTPDKFAFAKAISKAQRNALRALLPETMIQELVKKYLVSEKKPARIPQSKPQQPQPQSPTIEQPDPIINARKVTFAKRAELGIPDEDFKQYCYDKFGIKSRSQMTIGQWRLVYKDLIDGDVEAWVERKAIKEEKKTPLDPFENPQPQNEEEQEDISFGEKNDSGKKTADEMKKEALAKITHIAMRKAAETGENVSTIINKMAHQVGVETLDQASIFRLYKIINMYSGNSTEEAE